LRLLLALGRVEEVGVLVSVALFGADALRGFLAGFVSVEGGGLTFALLGFPEAVKPLLIILIALMGASELDFSDFPDPGGLPGPGLGLGCKATWCV